MTVNDVYRKIKELSALQANPRPALEVSKISTALNRNREMVLPLLSQLQDMKLIRFNEQSKTSVRLTLLGTNVNRDKV